MVQDTPEPRLSGAAHGERRERCFKWQLWAPVKKNERLSELIERAVRHSPEDISRVARLIRKRERGGAPP